MDKENEKQPLLRSGTSIDYSSLRCGGNKPHTTTVDNSVFDSCNSYEDTESTENESTGQNIGYNRIAKCNSNVVTGKCTEHYQKRSTDFAHKSDSFKNTQHRWKSQSSLNDYNKRSQSVTEPGLSLALDGGWGYMVVLGTLLCNLLMAAMSRAFGVFYPYIQLNFESSAATTTIIQSISNSIRLFGGPISSSLCDAYGTRPLVMVGGVLQALGYGLSCLAPNVYYLYFTLGLLTGIGGALIYSPIHICVNQYFNKRRGKALGLSTVGIGVGTFAMAPLQLYLLQEYGYFGMTIIMGGIMLNYLVGGALMRPIESNYPSHEAHLVKTQRQQKISLNQNFLARSRNPSVFYEQEITQSIPRISTQSDSQESDKQHEPSYENRYSSIYPDISKLDINTADNMNCADRKSNLADRNEEKTCLLKQETQNRETFRNETIRKRHKSFSSSVKLQVEKASTKWKYFQPKLKLFKKPSFILYCGQSMVLQFCTSAPLTFIIGLGSEYGFTETAATLLISVSGIFDILGRFLFGIVFDIQYVRPYRRALHAVLGLALGVLTGLIGLPNSYSSVLIIIAVHGLIEGGFHAQKTSVLAEFLPLTLMSDAVGFSFFFEGIGSLIAAPIFGILVDMHSTYSSGYYFCGGVFCTFTVFVLIEYLVSYFMSGK